MDGLLAYMANHSRPTRLERIQLPPPLPRPPTDRSAHRPHSTIRTFVQRTQSGLPSAEAHRAARRGTADRSSRRGPGRVLCVEPRSRAANSRRCIKAPIGTTQKPTHRRPVAIVPRRQLTRSSPKGESCSDLGDDRFWLLPRDLGDRTLFLTMRHGVSEVEARRASAGDWQTCWIPHAACPEPIRRRGPGPHGGRGRPAIGIPAVA